MSFMKFIANFHGESPKNNCDARCRRLFACRTGSNSLPVLFSRHVLSVLLAALLLLPTYRAHADDDLLDPDKIGASRKSLKTEGLLDPTGLGAKSSESTAASPGARRSGREAPFYARTMAESVTGSLDTLINAAAGLVAEVAKLDSEARELESKLRDLREEMETKLAEFRSGLFCSGCNKTKSEILARGEQFPHPGQEIIRPTPEQIERKERELQAPIDQADSALRANRARYGKARNDRDEALQQVLHGLKLWRTSISFESLLITLDEEDSIAAYKADRDQVEGQINKLDSEIFLEGMHSSIPGLTSEKTKLEARLKQLKTGAAANAKEYARVKTQLEQVEDKLQKAHRSKAKVVELTREKEVWSETLDKLDQQRVKAKQAYRSAMARAIAKAGSEKSSLDYDLNRLRSSTVLIPPVDSSAISAHSGFDSLGGLYRMGSYDPAQHAQILPRVESFVKAYQNTTGVSQQVIAVRNGGEATPELSPKQSTAPVVSPVNKMKRKLLDLLDCDPDAGDKCPSGPTGNPGGVRG